MKVVQTTDYPWDGKITLLIEEPSAAVQVIMVRIPGWVKGAIVTVNGTPIERVPEPGSYCRIERNWVAGDVVELNLPLPVRLLQSHPLVEETRNQVAVMRGPVVYCLESPDLPTGVRPTDVAFARNSQFTIEAGNVSDKPLAGIPMLVGTGFHRQKGISWAGQLYQEVASADSQSIPIKLIPYYAWDNRGKSEMTVWVDWVG